MSKAEGAAIAYVGPLKPALADIPGACAYLGNISRAKLYADILPALDIVRFGARTLVTIASLDRLIAANRKLASEQSSPDVSAPQPKRHQRPTAAAE